MGKKTLYESQHPNRMEQAFGMALGTIVAVDVDKRLCTVSTFHGKGSMNDQYIPGCQWLSMDSNPEGDEMTVIPRIGSMCTVQWIDGEPYVWGFFKPLSKGGTAAQGNEPKGLYEGDKVISTIGGSKITVKKSGLVELVSKETLKLTLFPKGSVMLAQCATLDLRASGGFFYWSYDDLTGQTNWKGEYCSDIDRTNVYFEQKGGPTFTDMYSLEVGPAIPGIQGTHLPVYTKKIAKSGETTTTVTSPVLRGTPTGFKSIISPEGAVHVSVGVILNSTFDVASTGAFNAVINKGVSTIDFGPEGAFSLANKIAKASVSAAGDIELSNKIGSAKIAATGDIAVANKIARAKITATGEVTIKNSGATITISPAGEVTVKSLKTTIDTTGPISIKSSALINLEATAAVAIKAKAVTVDSDTPIMLNGKGGKAANFALCFPKTLSQFTGSPLMPFSAGVMVSD